MTQINTDPNEELLAQLDELAEAYLDPCNGAPTRSALLAQLRLLVNDAARLTATRTGDILKAAVGGES